jgi:hypothetical protein
VRLRSLLIGIVLASGRASAQPAAHVNAAPEHARTLLLALGELPTSVDVALTHIDATPAGAELEVRVELRAAVSDEAGRILWSSAVHANARGPARQRALLERDALTAAAEQLAKLVRQRSIAE